MPQISLPSELVSLYTDNAPDNWLRCATRRERLQGDASTVGSAVYLFATWNGDQVEFHSESILGGPERYQSDLILERILPEDWSQVTFEISVDGSTSCEYSTDSFREADYTARDPFQDYLRQQEPDLVALGQRQYGRTQS